MICDPKLSIYSIKTFCYFFIEDAEEGFPVSPLDENLIDDNLTPLERLEKFYATEEIFER